MMNSLNILLFQVFILKQLFKYNNKINIYNSIIIKFGKLQYGNTKSYLIASKMYYIFI